MRQAFLDLDQILRGKSTQLDALRAGTLSIALGRIAGVAVVLGLAYGACMGVFALSRDGGPSFLQFLATTLKVPLLFALTVLVTFPSLYVFNALGGSRLCVDTLSKLLAAALAVDLAVLASVGPIVAFFALSTTSYSFMVMLNVAAFGISGSLGLLFLLRTLHRLTIAHEEEHPPLPAPSPTAVPATPPPCLPSGSTQIPSALDALDGRVLGRHERFVFRCWMVLFGLVGAQMGWVLRPFLGNPEQPFTWFRERESNFFEAISYHLANLFR